MSDESGAIFSPSRTHRYQLWRRWDDRPMLNVIGLNPSTADETANDPTIRRCIGFAKLWGYGGLMMTNIFAFRATDPQDMKRSLNPIGTANNPNIVSAALKSSRTLVAWGTHGAFMGRGVAVLQLLAGARISPICLGVTTKGHPKHPLYMASDTRPMTLELAQAIHAVLQGTP